MAEPLRRHAVGVHVEADAPGGGTGGLDDLGHHRDRVLQVAEGAAVVEPSGLEERLLVEQANDHRGRAVKRYHDRPVQALGNREAGEVVQHFGLVGDDDGDVARRHERPQTAETFLVFGLRKEHQAGSQMSRMASR